jgi:hypothetical protein
MRQENTATHSGKLAGNVRRNPSRLILAEQFGGWFGDA